MEVELCVEPVAGVREDATRGFVEVEIAQKIRGGVDGVARACLKRLGVRDGVRGLGYTLGVRV